MLSNDEKQILDNIPNIKSDNDPKNPEFPPTQPRFPATPTIRLKNFQNTYGFNDVWVKDESINPTGTHKDRMAWEIVVTYSHILIAKKRVFLKNRYLKCRLFHQGQQPLQFKQCLMNTTYPALKY